MPNPIIKVKKLVPQAKVPQAMSKEAAGLDLYVSDAVTFFPMKVYTVHTGIAVSIPKGYHLEVHIRSSWGARGIRLANCVGIIDSDYRGEIKLIVINDTKAVYHAPEGERIAQMILVKDPVFTVKEVDELDQTERGTGGFGSTDSEEDKGE